MKDTLVFLGAFIAIIGFFLGIPGAVCGYLAEIGYVSEGWAIGLGLIWAFGWIALANILIERRVKCPRCSARFKAKERKCVDYMEYDVTYYCSSCEYSEVKREVR